MAKARESLPGLTIGHALLGRHGDGRGSVAQQVHDGDTVITELAGNVSVRFLGIDTPEVSFMLPDGTRRFRSIASQPWIDFLTDPFTNAPQVFIDSLGTPLQQHLTGSVGANAATNHARHAEQAHRELERLVEADMQVLGQDRGTFHFFLAFAHEVMDGFGRLLCFINRSQRLVNSPAPRPLSYNERLLEVGLASPYFIWPNINPFRAQGSLIDAIPTAGNLSATINDPSLARARQFVSSARQNQDGIFEAGNALQLEPFELRFIARQNPPSRWVIDLSDANTDTLLPPTQYHTIPNPEDRLFVPREYVPLFVESRWKRGN